MKPDRSTVRRNAAIKGHDFAAGDTCPKCLLTVGEIAKLGHIPPCDVLGKEGARKDTSDRDDDRG